MNEFMNGLMDEQRNILIFYILYLSFTFSNVTKDMSKRVWYIPLVSGTFSAAIVYVLPVPVWPYAIIVSTMRESYLVIMYPSILYFIHPSIYILIYSLVYYYVYPSIICMLNCSFIYPCIYQPIHYTIKSF